jgi:hypothetical protein
VIVPLVADDNDLDSATTPSAFGAIAASFPPSPVIMAETLVHEFQHLKLCALMNIVPLIGKATRAYTRRVTRTRGPRAAYCKGLYAHIGVTRFRDAYRHVETEPDGILRAQVMYERWRHPIEPSTSTLLKAGCLSEAGVRFVEMLRDQGRTMQSEAVPAEAMDIAAEVALDHELTWQLRHTAIEAAALAVTYQRSEALPPLPEARITAEPPRPIRSCAAAC